MKKEINKLDIKFIMKKFNKNSVSFVDKVDIAKIGTDRAICSNGVNFTYDIKNNDILIVEKTITKDNIALYYEFMGDEDLEKLSYKVFWLEDQNKSVFIDRCHLVTKELNISFKDVPLFAKTLYADFKDIQLYHDKEKKYEDFTPYKGLKQMSGLIYFGVKDTLKPIDEYIAEIKDSSEYKEYISGNTLKAYIHKDNSDDVNIVISFNKKGSGDIEVSSYEMADYAVSCFNELKTNNSDDILELIEEYQISQGV